MWGPRRSQGLALLSSASMSTHSNEKIGPALTKEQSDSDSGLVHERDATALGPRLSPEAEKRLLRKIDLKVIIVFQLTRPQVLTWRSVSNTAHSLPLVSREPFAIPAGPASFVLTRSRWHSLLYLLSFLDRVNSTFTYGVIPQLC